MTSPSALRRPLRRRPDPQEQRGLRVRRALAARGRRRHGRRRGRRGRLEHRRSRQLRELDAEPSSDLLEAWPARCTGPTTGSASSSRTTPASSGMGTTVTAALFDGARLGVAHVGDSRGYLLRDGELSQITHDHTFVQTLIDEGRITEEEAKDPPAPLPDPQGPRRRHDTSPTCRRRPRGRRPVPALQRRPAACSTTTGIGRHPRDRARPTTPPSSWSAPPRGRQHRQHHLRRRRRRRRGRVAADTRAMLVGAAADLSAGCTCRPRWAASSAVTAPATPASSNRCAPSSPTASRRDRLRRRSTRDPEARYAPRPPRRFRGSAGCSRPSLCSALVWMAGAAAWSLEPDAVLRRRARRHGRDLPGLDADRRSVRRSRSPTSRPTSASTGSPTTTPRTVARGHRRRQPRRRPARGRAASRPSQTLDADAAAVPTPSATGVRRRRAPRPAPTASPTRPTATPTPTSERLTDDRSSGSRSWSSCTAVAAGAELFLLVLALAVGIGAYAAVGLGVRRRAAGRHHRLRRRAGRADRGRPRRRPASRAVRRPGAAARSSPPQRPRAWR